MSNYQHGTNIFIINYPHRMTPTFDTEYRIVLSNCVHKARCITHYQGVYFTTVNLKFAPTRLGDLFRSHFSTFWRLRQNVLKCDLKKSRICPIWAQSDPIRMPNMTTLMWRSSKLMNVWSQNVWFVNFVTSCWNQYAPVMVGLAPKWGAKCTEIWSVKAPDLSHFGPIWPNFDA